LKTRFAVRSLLVSAVALSLTAWLSTACPTTEVLLTIPEVTFDGSFLGPCSADAAPKPIKKELCPASCQTSALAYCINGSYSECACSNRVLCDATPECCPDPTTGYVPTPCKGKVAKTESSEDQCDADIGFLICNGSCFASFACELPSGYTVEVPDASRDAAPDAADAAPDRPSDAPLEAGDSEPHDGAGDSPGDAPEGG
jgi:hypothetical protein